MDHPKAIGDRSTLAVMLALYDAGYAVLLPFGENTRYDIVIEDGEGFRRVQCKTGRLRKGAVRFRASSSYAHHPNPKITSRDYLGEADYSASIVQRRAACTSFQWRMRRFGTWGRFASTRAGTGRNVEFDWQPTTSSQRS